MLVIAHRLSIIVDADQILVMDKGKSSRGALTTNCLPGEGLRGHVSIATGRAGGGSSTGETATRREVTVWEIAWLPHSMCYDIADVYGTLAANKNNSALSSIMRISPFIPFCFLPFMAVVASLPAALAQEIEACPPGQTVTVDLGAWATRTRTVKTLHQLNAQLESIGLEPVSDESGMCEKKPALRKLLVDHFKVELNPGVTSSVIQVLAGLCSAAWEDQQGAVFVPLAKDHYCRVEMPFLNRSGSGWGPQLCEPAVFGFEHLTSSSHKVIKLTDREEWCGTSGSDRGSKTTVSWWELHGWKLESLLETITWESYYHSPTPPVKERTTAVQIMGADFPKNIKLTEKVICNDPCDEEDEFCRNEVASCEKSKVVRICVYKGGSYHCSPSK